MENHRIEILRARKMASAKTAEVNSRKLARAVLSSKIERLGSKIRAFEKELNRFKKPTSKTGFFWSKIDSIIGSPLSRYQKLVADAKSAGLSPSDAVKQVERTHPGLRLRAIACANRRARGG